jgi:hypothetical protein
LSTQWNPRSSKAFSAEALPDPEIPVTITSSFAGLRLFAPARDLTDLRMELRGVMGSCYNGQENFVQTDQPCFDLNVKNS